MPFETISIELMVLIMHVKTRRKLNFRKEKHKTDHNYNGVNVACNTTIPKYKSLRVVSSWGA
ncbi:hypothetical protein BTM384_01260 [Helicobacter pylori]